MKTVHSKEDFDKHLGAGDEIKCGVCSQRSHVDGRPLDLALVNVLNLLRQLDERPGGWRQYFRLATVKKEARLDPGNVASLLRHWGLIEAKDPDATGKDEHGMYRITKNGKDFLLDELEVPRYCYTFQGKLYGMSDGNQPFDDGRNEWVSVSDISDFKYDELWLRP